MRQMKLSYILIVPYPEGENFWGRFLRTFFEIIAFCYTGAMFKSYYSQEELNKLVSNTSLRKGWDFSQMNVERQIVPWKYEDVVREYLTKEDSVLDIGTGGGERFLKFSSLIKNGVGIDSDSDMVSIAQENAKGINNISFYQDTQNLEKTNDSFNVILNRHAPFNLEVIRDHLKPNGYFITQQVGEENMLNIKKVLKRVKTKPPITRDMIESSGLKLTSFREYNVEYVVKDVESLVFWLQALDLLHADIQGAETLKSVDTFNRILEGNVDDRGFITNEHRYLVIAQKK